MIRLIHTSDNHLEKSLAKASYGPDLAMERREECWASLDRLISEKEADLFLLCGDLFESDYFFQKDFFRLAKIFDENSNKRIVICPGNHDPAGLYPADLARPNVYIFRKDRLTYFDFPDIKTRVYGLAWRKASYGPLDLSVKLDYDYINILMLHSDVFSDSGYMHVPIKMLENLGFSYIALGHIHKAQLLTDRIAYCGCLEPTDFAELGTKGYMEVKLSQSTTQIDFVPFASRTFIENDFILTPDMEDQDILEALKALSTARDFQRINLKGRLSRQTYASMEWIIEIARPSFYYVDFIRDYSVEEGASSNAYDDVLAYIDQIEIDEEVKDLARSTFMNYLARR